MVRIVTLPAQVVLAMRRHVDPRDVSGTGCALGMASAAKSSRGRLAGPNQPRGELVLVGRFMAREAGQCRMVGYGLLARDLAVACVASTRDHGRLWRVRFVTASAGDAGVMGYQVNLRKPGRATRVVGVAAWAGVALARDDRLDFHGVRYVSSCRPVAILARHTLVIAGQSLLHDQLGQRTDLDTQLDQLRRENEQLKARTQELEMELRMGAGSDLLDPSSQVK